MRALEKRPIQNGRILPVAKLGGGHTGTSVIILIFATLKDVTRNVAIKIAQSSG